ncbi:MAG TPA: inositol monophosphatase family protein, partial [Elusimicrobiota bacterium]|nr:inositol monophosphatase family protein [Elusimicrobiota bacterium]
MSDLCREVVDICLRAGEAILRHYRAPEIAVSRKEDQSPLTAADLEANAIILAGLARAASGAPVISEESERLPWEARKDLRDFWLVDPLDGTKEFIQRRDEFTVNVARVRGGEP